MFISHSDSGLSTNRPPLNTGLCIRGKSKNTALQSHERNSLCSLGERAKAQPYNHKKETAFAHWEKEQKHHLSFTRKKQPLLIGGKSKNTTLQSHERNSLCSLGERAKTQPYNHMKETAFAHWEKQKHSLTMTWKEQPLLIAGKSKNTTSQSHERNSLCSLGERAKTQPLSHMQETAFARWGERAKTQPLSHM